MVLVSTRAASRWLLLLAELGGEARLGYVDGLPSSRRVTAGTGVRQGGECTGAVLILRLLQYSGTGK
jgi:hypothetical protein